MSPAFLSPKQSRIFSAKQKRQLHTFRIISELLLQNDFPEALCRELLNGRRLFSVENERAARIISEALPSFFESQQTQSNKEPISFEDIIFIYQFLSQTIPPDIKQLLLKILTQREQSLADTVAQEKESLQNLQRENQAEIQTINQTLSKNYTFALLLFFTIASGIFILFIGFYSTDYLLVIIGLVLIVPSLFITENPSGFVQFRKDSQKQAAVSSLKKQIEVQSKQIAVLKASMDDIILKKAQLVSEPQPPNHA